MWTAENISLQAGIESADRAASECSDSGKHPKDVVHDVWSESWRGDIGRSCGAWLRYEDWARNPMEFWGHSGHCCYEHSPPHIKHCIYWVQVERGTDGMHNGYPHTVIKHRKRLVIQSWATDFRIYPMQVPNIYLVISRLIFTVYISRVLNLSSLHASKQGRRSSEKKTKNATGNPSQTGFNKLKSGQLCFQKFPTDPKANWSGQVGSFQLAKTRSRIAPHWYA